MTKWRDVTFGALFDISSSKRVLQEDWKSSGVPFYRAREIVKLAKNGVVENELFISEELYETFRRKYGVPMPGDLMVSAVGTLGACYVVQPTDRFYYKDASVLRFSPKQEVCSKFIQHAFRTREILDQVQASSGSTVGTYTINRAAETRIRLPSLPEQRRIAAILDQADALRSKRREALAQLDSLAQSIFIEIFGSVHQIFENWPTRPLGEMLEFLTSGSRGWAEYYSETGALFLRIQNVGRDELDLSDVAYVNAPDSAESRRTEVREGDVLLSITADLGRTGVVPEGIGKAHINQHLSILRTKKVAPRYLSAFLASPAGQREVMGRNKHGVKAGLNFDDIRALRIPLPPEPLQNEFISRAEQVRTQVGALKRSLAELDALFASLQHRAFRGEL